MTEVRKQYKYPRFSRVFAPILADVTGVGTVDAYIAPIGADLIGVLVRFDKKDYAPEHWARISPTNQACVFERFPEDSLSAVLPGVEHIAKSVIPSIPVEISEKPIDSLNELLDPPVKPMPVPPTPTSSVGVDAPALHQIWKSNRGNSRYEIIEIDGPDIVFKEVGISYKRDMTWAKILKGYTYEGMA